MRTRDDQVKRQQDELTKIRNEFAAVTKKEGGNLMTKDFTDDIYERGFEDRWFIPETSEMFCNLLVVVPNLKLPEFKLGYWRMIEDYYTNNDAAEEAKIPEVVEKKYKALKEAQGEAWEALVKSVTGGEPGEFTEGDEKNALNILRTQEEKAFKKKKASRFPFALIPDALKELPKLDDKDKENTVLRLVAFRPQLDDI